MALSKDQFMALRNKGLSVEQIVSFEKNGQPVQSMQATDFKTQTPTSFLGKARDVATSLIGGGKLAEGAGMAIAAPKVQQDLSQVQSQGSDILLSLSKHINEQKAAGNDVTKLQQTYKQLESDLGTTSQDQQNFTGALPSNEQVIGSATRLAGTVAGGAIAGGFNKATALGKATTVLGGIGRGAAAGAGTGAVEGGIQGAGLAAEANKSSQEVLASGALGAIGGAITGGVLGGAIGGVSGGLKGRAIRKEQFVNDLVSPKMSAKDRSQAIYQGRLKSPSLLGQAEIQISKHDQQLANSVSDVVSPKATISQNVDAIRMKIDHTDNGVRAYIDSHKVPFNQNQLRSKLETGKQDLHLIFASDTTAEKTYNAVVKAFLDTVGKKDTSGLFEARQNFDQIPAIQKLLQNDKLGENAKKEIVLSVRQAANSYISDLLPNGNPYKRAMLNQTYALEALGNLADKSAHIIGKNNLQLLTEKYPVMKWIIGGVGAGLAGSAGIGVGNAIIGSTN